MKQLVRGMLAITAAAVIFSGLGAQDMGSIQFIDNLGDKKTVTFGEGVKFYVITLGYGPGYFQTDIAFLRNNTGIVKGLDKGENEPLQRGDMAILISQHLKLKDSLLYRIFGGKRYATRACSAAGIMAGDCSERDILTGDELIEIMTRLSEKMKGTDNTEAN